jgi:hypothetical protein
MLLDNDLKDSVYIYFHTYAPSDDILLVQSLHTFLKLSEIYNLDVINIKS